MLNKLGVSNSKFLSLKLYLQVASHMAGLIVTCLRLLRHRNLPYNSQFLWKPAFQRNVNNFNLIFSAVLQPWLFNPIENEQKLEKIYSLSSHMFSEKIKGKKLTKKAYKDYLALIKKTTWGELFDFDLKTKNNTKEIFFTASKKSFPKNIQRNTLKLRIKLYNQNLWTHLLQAGNYYTATSNVAFLLILLFQLMSFCPLPIGGIGWIMLLQIKLSSFHLSASLLLYFISSDFMPLLIGGLYFLFSFIPTFVKITNSDDLEEGEKEELLLHDLIIDEEDEVEKSTQALSYAFDAIAGLDISKSEVFPSTTSSNSALILPNFPKSHLTHNKINLIELIQYDAAMEKILAFIEGFGDMRLVINFMTAFLKFFYVNAFLISGIIGLLFYILSIMTGLLYAYSTSQHWNKRKLALEQAIQNLDNQLTTSEQASFSFDIPNEMQNTQSYLKCIKEFFPAFTSGLRQGNTIAFTLLVRVPISVSIIGSCSWICNPIIIGITLIAIISCSLVSGYLKARHSERHKELITHVREKFGFFILAKETERLKNLPRESLPQLTM